MSHVFISYSRKDIDAANYVADQLSQRGADVFVDYKRLEAGQNFPERLAAEIEQSDAVVFLLSQHSAASQWVRDEIQYARHCQKKIIPVALDSTEMPRALFFLTAVERVDFTRWQTDRQVEAAVAKLVMALPPPVTPSPPPAAKPVGEGLRPSPEPQPSPPAPLPKGEGRKPPPETRADFKPAPTTPLQLPDLSAILPPPFEWCLIPAGQVTLKSGGYVPEGGQTFDVPAFAMAKYPITNAQFDVFARAKDGYRDAMWWDYSDEAKAWRKKNVTPKDPAFGGVGDHPRANVCWYEAAAFCRWLNWKSLTLNPSPFDGEGRRGGEVITLPTEQQWQRAAQGDDGREYPWGSTFDAKRCNTLESGIRQTTPVTAYPDGASPFGVMDMAGNVWEWCLTDYNTGANDLTANSSWRVLRGCSFMRDRYRATVLYRIYYGDDPFYGDYWFGFRVACGGVPS